ncbi:MAG TPA: magnesium transporter [Candidatus Krumholzibacteria bacterium]|nr:magnesium transporter [Candidatus Krumholzibacteria bacterium]
MEQDRTQDIETARGLLAAGRVEELDRFLAPLHSADIAEILTEFEVEEQAAMLKRIGTERAAEVLTELDSKSGLALLQLLTDHEVVALLEELPSDDAADLISSLPPETTERVEALLPSEDRDEIHELLEFGPETAGGLMQVERVWVREDATIQDAIDFVRRVADEVESPQRVYVVSESDELVGVLSIMDLVLKPPHVRVHDVIERNVPAIPVDMDQEQVAAMFSKYDEFTMPVVDTGGRLVGRITMDDIIDVMEEEATEDITAIAGTTDEELGETSIVRVSRSRLPWLLTGFFGEVVGAVLMSRYEASLATFVVLVFFIPLIVATAGNIGVQAAVVVVREIALGQIDLKRTGQRVFKEIQVAFLNGMVLGALLFGLVYAWRQDAALGGLLWVTLLMVVFVAAVMGSAIPLFLNRLKIDPALASGPFVTVSNDIIGMAIYLALATAYLRNH